MTLSTANPYVRLPFLVFTIPANTFELTTARLLLVTVLLILSPTSRTQITALIVKRVTISVVNQNRTRYT